MDNKLRIDLTIVTSPLDLDAKESHHQKSSLFTLI